MPKVVVAAVAVIVLTGTAFAQDPLILRGFGSHIGVSIRDESGGVAIEKVESGTPAERAGFRSGDVVVEFDGEKVRSARQFTRVVEETRPDRPVSAVVMRDGSRQTLTVTPENRRQAPVRLPQVTADLERNLRRSLPELRGNFDLPNPGDFDVPSFFLAFSPRRLGAELTPLSDQLASYFGVKAGVLVSTVDANSPAAQAGLKSGDVITAVNGTAVDSPSDVTQALRRPETGSSVDIRVMREKKELTLKATLPDAARPDAPARRILLNRGPA